MSDAPLRGYNGRHEWFWEPNDEAHIFPLENLMEMYYKSVGRNSTLIMGLTPDTSGLLPEPDVKRLKEWGDEIEKHFSNPFSTTKGNGKVLILGLRKETKVNHLILQENIAEGERVRSYKIEALIDEKWQEVAAGTSIGHKRIQQIKSVKTSALKLTVLKSTAEPMISNFSVFFVD